MKLKAAAPVKTEQTYLIRLGKYLLHYFPLTQVQEILDDYQEHFSAGREWGGTDETLIATLGAPENAAADILREAPDNRSYRLRHTVCWGLLLAFSCLCLILRYSYYGFLAHAGTYLFLLLGSLSLFILLHGRGQAMVESRFRRIPPQPPAVVYLLPLAAAAGTECLLQYMLWYFTTVGTDHLPTFIKASQIGRLTALVLQICQIVLALLLVWILRQFFSVSVRYYPFAVYTLGAMLSIREIHNFLHGMDISAAAASPAQQLLECLLPFAAGFLLAALFRQHIREITGKGA